MIPRLLGAGPPGERFLGAQASLVRIVCGCSAKTQDILFSTQRVPRTAGCGPVEAPLDWRWTPPVIDRTLPNYRNGHRRANRKTWSPLSPPSPRRGPHSLGSLEEENGAGESEHAPVVWRWVPSGSGMAARGRRAGIRPCGPGCRGDPQREQRQGGGSGSGPPRSRFGRRSGCGTQRSSGTEYME